VELIDVFLFIMILLDPTAISDPTESFEGGGSHSARSGRRASPTMAGLTLRALRLKVKSALGGLAGLTGA
jgi:hypothetical protein